MAKKFRIDKGTIARAVKKLEAAGYVTRKLDPKSKRAIRLFPTVKAEEIAQYLFNLDVTWGDKVTSSLTEEEQEHLMTILHKIAYKSLCMSSGPVEIQPEDMQAINNRK